MQISRFLQLASGKWYSKPSSGEFLTEFKLHFLTPTGESGVESESGIRRDLGALVVITHSLKVNELTLYHTLM